MSEETQEIKEEQSAEAAETPDKAEAPAAETAPEEAAAETPAAEAAPEKAADETPAAEASEGDKPASGGAAKTKKVNRLSADDLDKKIKNLEEKDQVHSKYYRHLLDRKNELERANA